MINKSINCLYSDNLQKENLTNFDDKKMLIKNFLSNMNDEIKFKLWLRTLLSAYSIFPEIIKTIDRIIELQASTVSFVQDIYNGKNTPLDQMERVIDLGERKNHLINIFYMTKEMLKDLPTFELEIIKKRYCDNWSVEEISREYDISSRTAYRKLDKAMNLIFEFCKLKNWSLRLIESQIKNENWLKDRFKKTAIDYFKNINYCEEKTLSK